MNNRSDHPSSMKQRHVLILQRGDEGYGVASTVTEFALALRNNELPVSFVCVAEGRLCEGLRNAGFSVDVLGIKMPPRAITGSLPKRVLLNIDSLIAQKAIANAIIKSYDGAGVDVVQTMNYSLLDSCGRIATAFEAVGVWRMGSGVQSEKYKAIKQFMMSRVCNRHGLVNMANSDFTRESIGRKSALSVYVHHGCNAVRFNPETVNAVARTEFDIAESDIVFGIFAHIHPNGEKGQHLAVDALCGYLNQSGQSSKVHLVLFGDPVEGDYVSAMQDVASTCNNLTLHLPGSVSDVERYYGLIDVSLSTRISPEPFGLSVIESMMMGVPVLAHALGGPAETVIDNQTGWLVADSSVEQWVAAFERVISQRDRWPELAAQARAHALKNFTIDAEVAGWSKALDRIEPATTR